MYKYRSSAPENLSVGLLMCKYLAFIDLKQMHKERSLAGRTLQPFSAGGVFYSGPDL